MEVWLDDGSNDRLIRRHQGRGGGRPLGWKPGVERDDQAEVERRMAEIRARKAGER